MSRTTAAAANSAVQTIPRLLEISKLDTLYRDLYMQRASALLEQSLTRSAYSHLKEKVNSLEFNERQLRASVERGDWKRSAELTERVRATKNAAAASADSLRLGTAVYEGLADIPIDPFSSGFHVFVGGTAETLRDQKNQALSLLSTLARSDPSKGDFYARRTADFQALSIKAPGKQQTEEKAVAGPAQLQQQALSALDSGDLSQLEQAIQKLMQRPVVQETKQQTVEVKPDEVADVGEDMLYSFSQETLAGASRLGLTPAQTRSRRQFAHLIPHGWQPSFMKTETKKWSKDQLSRLSYPSDTTNKGREAIEFYLLNPFNLASTKLSKSASWA